MAMNNEKIIEDVQKGMAFAVPFAHALVKLRKAVALQTAVTLDKDEARAIMDGFKLLRSGTPKKKPSPPIPTTRQKLSR